MPIFKHLVNVIIPKDVIETKFNGGTQAFRKWFMEENGEYRDEDNELFSVARMNSCEFVVEYLVKNGLKYDSKNERSVDFVCVTRYEGLLWKTDWVQENSVYVWHKNCKKEQIELAHKVAAKPMDEIADAFDRGEKPWETIR